MPTDPNKNSKGRKSSESKRAADMTERFGAREKDGAVRCDACPVLCRIKPERSGACKRYANVDGELARVDPLVLFENTRDSGEAPWIVGHDSIDSPT